MSPTFKHVLTPPPNMAFRDMLNGVHNVQESISVLHGTLSTSDLTTFRTFEKLRLEYIRNDSTLFVKRESEAESS